MQDKQFDVHPDDCPHPESRIETIQFVRSGRTVEQCQACGFEYLIFGDHRRVVVEGEYIDSADLHCDACGMEVSSHVQLRRSRCEGDP